MPQLVALDEPIDDVRAVPLRDVVLVEEPLHGVLFHGREPLERRGVDPVGPRPRFHEVERDARREALVDLCETRAVLLTPGRRLHFKRRLLVDPEQVRREVAPKVALEVLLGPAILPRVRLPGGQRVDGSGIPRDAQEVSGRVALGLPLDGPVHLEDRAGELVVVPRVPLRRPDPLLHLLPVVDVRRKPDPDKGADLDVEHGAQVDPVEGSPVAAQFIRRRRQVVRALDDLTDDEPPVRPGRAPVRLHRLVVGVDETPLLRRGGRVAFVLETVPDERPSPNLGRAIGDLRLRRARVEHPVVGLHLVRDRIDGEPRLARRGVLGVGVEVHSGGREGRLPHVVDEAHVREVRRRHPLGDGDDCALGQLKVGAPGVRLRGLVHRPVLVRRVEDGKEGLRRGQTRPPLHAKVGRLGLGDGVPKEPLKNVRNRALHRRPRVVGDEDDLVRRVEVVREHPPLADAVAEILPRERHHVAWVIDGEGLPDEHRQNRLVDAPVEELRRHECPRLHVCQPPNHRRRGGARARK